MDSATLPPPTGADARGLALRAGEAEGMGHWDAAGRLYALAFRASVLDHDLAAAADALRGQARVRNHQRRFDEADELAGLSLEIAERHGLHQAAARALNVLGIIRYSVDDWNGARTLYTRALDLALDLGDDELAGLACQNAGVIAHLQGDLREARKLYLESIGSFVRSGNSANAMMAYNNLGTISVYLGEWMEAEVYFSRGIEIGERLSHSPALARLYSNRAHPLLQIGETARARATLEHAERAALAVGDRGTLAEVEKFRGMLAHLEGRLDDAEAHLLRALEMGKGAATAFDRAEMVRELGRLREVQERPREAHELYARAAEAFRSVGARHHVRVVEERLAALD
jgi:tetratricopeptide (TPR) repeat protein